MTFSLGLIIVIALAAIISFLASKFASHIGIKSRAVCISLLVGWIPFVNTLQVIGMGGLPSKIFLFVGYIFFSFAIAFPIAFFLARWLERPTE